MRSLKTLRAKIIASTMVSTNVLIPLYGMIDGRNIEAAQASMMAAKIEKITNVVGVPYSTSA